MAGAEEGPRHEAREHAVALLYEAEMKQATLPEVLDALSVSPDPFTVALLRGVDAEAARIDELIADAAVGWEIDRMPVVDRTILRLATWELLARPDVPVPVVIDEAVELAKQYSTEQSGGFVNGVLSTIANRVRPA
ncbi:MAG TPA: transcription antitermination factor NusB [Acidimicrobiales bacterium]|nr:transcription antitermination factor NusB [Acidimicrobiales bacterium]